MHVRKHTPSLRTVALAATALAPLATLTGCVFFASTPRSAVQTASPYHGPPAQLREMQSEHIAVFTTPTGGWTVRFDRTEPAHKETRAFVTLKKPDPAHAVTQALTTHTVSTMVDADKPVAVYARVVDHDQTPTSAPYRRVIDSQRER